MKFGIIKEGKNPPDKRVVLTPKACKELKNTFSDIEIIVEKSENRTFADREYSNNGIEIVDDVADADVMLGVKEVPIKSLIPNKKYFFFSHTIKKQPYNRDLLRAILDKNIELYDHEVITDQKEIKPIDSKSKPKEELDKKPQKTQLKSSVKAESEPNIEQKDSYENSDSKKDKLKNVPKENVTKTNPPKIKAPKKDEDEDSKTFTSGDQISLL